MFKIHEQLGWVAREWFVEFMSKAKREKEKKSIWGLAL